MKQPQIFAIAQTDARQAAAGRALQKQGYTVLGIEDIARADYILLPLPLDDDHADLIDLLKAAKPNAIAFGGKISPQVTARAHEIGILLIDYFAREELAILNAIPTAEGCISLLFTHQTSTLFESEILLIGFGRIAKALAVRLKALGAHVCIAARKASDRAHAFSLGCATINATQLTEHLHAYPCIVNTAPDMVLPRESLMQLPQNSLIIDLASRPGGVDFASARALGHRAIHALSLPATCAPESAGDFVAQTILEILKESIPVIL